MSYSFGQASFNCSGPEHAAIDPLPGRTAASSLVFAPADDLRPLPLILSLPLIAGLSLALWAGIARIVGALIAG